ncbi:MAG: hypothetical protein ABII97_03225 [Patescibacteria group bacterium]
MYSIKDLLSRFKKLKPRERNIEEEAKKIVSSFFDQKVNYITVYKKPLLIIKSDNPSFKNEVFFKKEEIIKRLKDRFGEKFWVDILFK